MTWATRYIEQLQAGETVSFRPHGNSMSPRIKSGALVTVEPVLTPIDVVVGDVVLCHVSGADYLHLVKATRFDRNGRAFQIGNNHGGVNGWTHKVYGKCTSVEP